MSLERTEAVVLRAADFSETSRIVTFLSPDRGRLSCMAAGVKRPKNPLSALLDTFNRLEIVYYWKESRVVQKLADATLLERFAGIKDKLEKMVYGAFPLEVAYKTAHENEPSHILYATLVRGLESLAGWSGTVKTHAAWQVLQLLAAGGFQPAVDRCAACGQPVAGRIGFAYDGGAVCGSCRADRRLSPTGYSALCLMAHARDQCPTTEGAEEVFEVLGGYAAEQLGTDLRSLRLIRQMSG